MLRRFLILIPLLHPLLVWAEIVTDGTLGGKAALSGPHYTVADTLGVRTGNHLFHSFAQFSLAGHESATFTGPDAIERVISRVTGGAPSALDGTLAVAMPNADFYFFNPAGVLFGPNAQLDVPGSVHISTAPQLLFEDGTAFSALAPGSQLTTAPPQAFGFVNAPPATLTVNGSTLALTSPQETLSLTGGEVRIQSASIAAAPGQLHIAGASSAGTLAVFDDGIQGTAQPADVQIKNSLLSASGGGDLAVRAKNLSLDNALLSSSTNTQQNAGTIAVQAENITGVNGGRFAGNSVSKEANAGRGGSIELNATGNITFQGRSTQGASGITATANAGGGGNIDVQAANLSLQDGAQISATTFGQRQGGQVDIQAEGSVHLAGVNNQGVGSSIFANSRGQGNAGAVRIRAAQLNVENGGLIGSSALASGNGGNLEIKTDTVRLQGEDGRGVTSSILANTSVTGKGGVIEVQTGAMEVLDGAMVRSDSAGTGAGGSIAIAAQSLTLAGNDSSGYGALISSNSNAAGNAGAVQIQTDELTIKNGGQVGSSAFSTGHGGVVDITVRGAALITGQDQSEDAFHSGVFSTSEGEEAQAGNAGTLVIKADTLTMAEGAEISAFTSSTGRGGDIGIQTGSMEMRENSLISARSDSRSDAGQVYVHITQGNLVMHDATIETEALSADGGDVVVRAPGHYLDLRNSRISTSVNQDFGGGGNIALNPEFLLLDHSQIFAKAKKGKGGNIDILTSGVYNYSGEAIEQVINASSELGVDGVVEIHTPDESGLDSFFALPTGLMTVDAALTSPCGQSGAQNRIVITQPPGVSTVGQGDFLPAGISARVQE